MSIEKNKKYHLNYSVISKRPIYNFFKRIFDLIFSSFGVIVISPFLVIIAMIIKLSDGGPVFYTQARVGINGDKFKIIKFRSMCVDADKKINELKDKNDVDGPMFKIKNDPRITKVGRFLRKTSIDELPQLINVIKGDMSLVGPRPPLPAEVDVYSEYDRQRLWVTPGMTGLWQVTVRNSVGFHEMVELDLEYISKANLWFDFIILLKTVKVVIHPNDAY
ncbi:sugar transferase [Ligilactobacillus equi]